MKRSWCTWLIVLFTLYGCSTAPPQQNKLRLYEGVARPSDQVAFIMGDLYPAAYSINGKKYINITVEVLPGDYLLKAAYFNGRIFRSTEWADIPITVEAGKKYFIRKAWLVKRKGSNAFARGFMNSIDSQLGIGDRLYIWIEEHLSGVVVGGYKPFETADGVFDADWEKGYDGYLLR